MTILFCILIILLKALADSQNDSGHKGLGHVLTGSWMFILLSMPYIIELPVWSIQIIAFTLFMIAIFDLAYNIFRGLPISYIGTTPWWDQIIVKVPFGFMLFVRGICLIVGISLLLGLHNRVIEIVKSLL